MTQVIITNITGLGPNYMIYVCNVFGDDCISLDNLTSTVPPIVSYILPPSFDTAPAIGLKIITSDGCERFHILYCENFDPEKLFQDGTEFYFMSGDIYDFQ
jgi:hypothetical protein